MRILFVSDTYYPHINGVYYFVCRIAPYLQEKGHKVAVFAPSEKIFFSKKKIDNIDVHGIPSLPIIYDPTIRFPIPVLLKSRVKDLIENFKPDIIHIQDHFLLAKTVVKVNKTLGIPIIATNHFMPENFTALVRSEKWKTRIEKMLWPPFSNVFNRVLCVTTPTETGARLIRHRLKVKVMAISSGIDLKKFNPFGDTNNIREKYFIPHKPVLLYVGRLDPEKHIEEILQAVALAEKKIDFSLVVVGKGTKKTTLERLTKKLGLAGNVIFTGFVPDEELPYFYKLARCFIIASIAELLSLVTLQAMASGLPVIAVNAGALPELVKDKINGFLVPVGDIQSLAQHINDIVTNDDLFLNMSEKSLEFVQQHDIRKTVESFENIYKTHSSKG